METKWWPATEDRRQSKMGDAQPEKSKSYSRTQEGKAKSVLQSVCGGWGVGGQGREAGERRAWMLK